MGRREVAALVLILVFTVFGAIPVQANPAEVAASKRLVKVAADNAFPPYEYVSSHGILDVYKRQTSYLSKEITSLPSALM